MVLCKGKVTYGKRGGAYMVNNAGTKVSCKEGRSTWYGGMLPLGDNTYFRMMVSIRNKKPEEYALLSNTGKVYVHKKVMSKVIADKIKVRIVVGGSDWKPLDMVPRSLTKSTPRFFGHVAGLKKTTAALASKAAPKKKAVKPKTKKAVKPKTKKAVKSKTKKAVKPKKKRGCVRGRWVAYDFGAYQIIYRLNAADRVTGMYKFIEGEYVKSIPVTKASRKTEWNRIQKHQDEIEEWNWGRPLGMRCGPKTETSLKFVPLLWGQIV